LLSLAVASAVTEVGHSKADAAPVLIARKAIAAGAVVTGSDVSLARWPRTVRPAGALSTLAAVGRRAAGPIEIGEALTSARLVGDELSKGLGLGLAAVPIEVEGAAVTSLIHAGDFVDLISPPVDGGNQPLVLAERVLVLAVLPGGSETVGDTGAELVVAVDRVVELKVASAAGRAVFPSLRSPP